MSQPAGRLCGHEQDLSERISSGKGRPPDSASAHNWRGPIRRVKQRHGCRIAHVCFREFPRVHARLGSSSRLRNPLGSSRKHGLSSLSSTALCCWRRQDPARRWPHSSRAIDGLFFRDDLVAASAIKKAAAELDETAGSRAAAGKRGSARRTKTAAPTGTRVVYISPLKALGVDVDRNCGRRSRACGRSPSGWKCHIMCRRWRCAVEIPVSVSGRRLTKSRPTS